MWSKSKSALITSGKRILLFLFAIIFSVNGFAQVPNWLWARGAAAAGNYISEGTSVATDADGNVYITGQSSGTTFFGPFTVGSGVFLVKYNSSGSVLWVQSAGGYLTGNVVAVDDSGNVYVTGSFQDSSVTFGSYTLINAYPFGAYTDIYLVKYDSSGTALWAKSAGSTYNDNAKSVTTDAQGNVYIAGSFGSPSITFGAFTLMTSGIIDMFLVKYDPAGNVIWAKRAGGTGQDGANAVTANSSGNTFVTGGFGSPSIIFGTDTLINTNPTFYDMFLTEYDPNGNVLWSVKGGGTSYESGLDVALDASGDIYLTGHFASPFAVFGTDTVVNYGNRNFYLAKYNPSGGLTWVKSGHGHQAETGWSLATDNLNDVYLSGGFNQGFPSDTLVFGTDTLISPTLISDPAFLYKLDSEGNVLCSSVLTSGGDDECDVAADYSGNVYFTGDYFATSFVLGNDTLSSPGYENAFLAKWTCSEITGFSDNIISNALDYISLSPNPAKSEFTVYDLRFTISEIEIYNMMGEKVFSQKPPVNNQKQITINISDFSPGIYFVGLANEKELVTKKVVVQR